MASESNIRPVTDGEANESDAELRGRLTQLALNALHATSHSKPNWREEQKALFDAIAALARQAPAPLSQAVPEGEHSRLHEWAMAAGLADVECEEAEIRPFLQRFAALVLSSQPQAVPEGWKLERDTGGGAIIINGPNDVGGCVAYREPIAGRMIPEAILFALADSLLSRHPQPQAVTEDARDGEREHSPDDMTVPKPTADLKVGDYVFACRWSDGEPGDPWSVGWIDEINLSSVIVPFVVLRGSPRGWRHAMKITEEQGHRICALYPEAESRPHQERLAVRAKAFGLAARATTSGSEGEGR